MQGLVVQNIRRFIIILLLQVLVLKQVDISWENFNYIFLMIYPIFILLLPLKVTRSIQIILAFVLGMSVDLFYDTPGLHTSALLFTAFIRKYILKFLEPVEGYSTDSTPTIRKYGFNWFLIYSSILMFLHLLFFFSVEAFSFVFLFDILLKTIFSFIFSQIIVVLYVLILNPK
jgi:hypothetical protein